MSGTHPSGLTVSICLLSAADDEEYAAQRRRWHEEQSNDLALVALPDHNSEHGYYSDAGNSTVEGNSKDSSDSHDS